MWDISLTTNGRSRSVSAHRIMKARRLMYQHKWTRTNGNSGYHRAKVIHEQYCQSSRRSMNIVRTYLWYQSWLDGLKVRDWAKAERIELRQCMVQVTSRSSNATTCSLCNFPGLSTAHRCMRPSAPQSPIGGLFYVTIQSRPRLPDLCSKTRHEERRSSSHVPEPFYDTVIRIQHSPSDGNTADICPSNRWRMLIQHSPLQTACENRQCHDENSTTSQAWCTDSRMGIRQRGSNSR